MKKIMAGVVLLFVSMQAASAHGQSSKYPPLSEYMMTPEAELALARSAAPEAISGQATVKILTASGYKVATEGDNGFVRLVMRGWGAPTFTPAQLRDLVYYAKLRAPICFNPVASRTVLPLQELRPGWEWKARRRTRSLKWFRRRMSKASYLEWRWWRSRICSLQTRISGLELVIGILT
jgi:hypothetical protein